MSSHGPSREPLVVVIGATGTGKSKLAVSLASRLNGEIINADAMQMYRGLPVITNKIPEHEMNGIPHHMLDFIGLEEKPWTVTQFVGYARTKIEEIRGRGKLPVVVGGTGYYVHGLLLKDALLGAHDTEGKTVEWVEAGEGDKEKFAILDGSVEEMYDNLMELDPEMAKSWHPKDRRRIQRSLEICLKRGRKASELYAEQKEAHQQTTNGGQTHEGLEYDTLFLWLDAGDHVLKERLNRRVDVMVEDGLFEEALELSEAEQEFMQHGAEIDKSKGIWVSIGYKELEAWAGAHTSDPASATKDSKMAFECIEAVKAGTRQYAKRQNRYIRIRLANALKQAGELDRLFVIDGTDVSRWDETVEPQSRDLVSAFLEGRALPKASTLSGLAEKTFAAIGEQGRDQSARATHRCEVCDKFLMTDKEWQLHLTSRTHKNTVQSQRRRALNKQSVPVVVADVEPDIPP